MEDEQIKVLIFGAHPDDPDLGAGGTAALYSRQGHLVKMVSLTNGDAGHHLMGGAPLAWRRRAEAAAAGAVLGCEYITLDNHDGELEASLAVRRQVIEIIRDFDPHLVMSPRPWDYHPDHRYTAQAVQDALYMVTVPNVVSHVAHLRKNPAALYLWDGFQKPYPFTPNVVVAIDEVIEQKFDAIHCHASQFYEWLPYNAGVLDQVPEEEAARRAWLRERREVRMQHIADLYRERLIELYGPRRGSAVCCAEAFEVSEYGAALTAEQMRRLFPFFTDSPRA